MSSEHEETATVIVTESEIDDNLSIVLTPAMQTTIFDEQSTVEVTEPSKFPTSTTKTKKTRTTKQKKEYTKRPKDSPRQRPTISRRTSRVPLFTGPFSKYQRTSSISPITINYPNKPDHVVADPVAEPHPFNINLSVYLYPQKEDNDESDDYKNDEDVIEKPELNIRNPVLLANEKIPIVPPGFEPVVNIHLEGNNNKKKV